MALKINRLFIGYSILLVIMITFAMYNVFWGISVLRYSSEPNILYVIVMVPWMLLLQALPLSVFIFLLFKKGGASAYFEHWNMGRRFRIPSMLLLLGYIIAIIPAPVNIFMHGNLLYNFSGTFNQIYFSTIYSGFALMLSGLVTFIGLWIIHRRGLS